MLNPTPPTPPDLPRPRRDMPHLIRTVLLTLACCVLLPTGCTTLTEGVVKRPTGEVLGVRVVDKTQAGVRVEATVRVTNPNPVELPVEEASVSFRLGERGRSFEAPVQPAVSLPPNGAQTFTVAAAVPLPGRTVAAGLPYRFQTTLHYRPPGELREIMTESGIGLPSLTVGGNGRLSE